MRTLAGTGLAVTATAVAGAAPTDPRSGWYAGLDKPPWQPPPPAYGLVWTPLYGALAVAAARTLDRAGPTERGRFATAFAANLALNAGWNWVFFGARRPKAALAEIALLELSTLDLVRRSGRVDRTARRLLLPYAAWVAFAAALNAEIARRNPAS